jgi:hypothetical protein
MIIHTLRARYAYRVAESSAEPYSLPPKTTLVADHGAHFWRVFLIWRPCQIFFSPRVSRPEQRSIITYWMCFHATGREIQLNLAIAFGEDPYKVSVVHEWIRAFRCGRTNGQEMPHTRWD